MASFEAFGGIIRVDYTEGKRSGAFSRIGSIQFTDAGPQILPATDWTPVPSLWSKGADVPQE
jgi:hypothetical protein